MNSHALDVLNNLCNMFIADGQVHEEVIEMLLDAGSDVDLLKEIGFSDDQIRNYAYYEGMMTGRTREEVLEELYSKGETK